MKKIIAMTAVIGAAALAYTKVKKSSKVEAEEHVKAEVEDRKWAISQSRIVEDYFDHITTLIDLHIEHVDDGPESMDTLDKRIDMVTKRIARRRERLDRFAHYDFEPWDTAPAKGAMLAAIAELKDIRVTMPKRYEMAIEVIDSAINDLNMWLNAIKENEG